MICRLLLLAVSNDRDGHLYLRYTMETGYAHTPGDRTHDCWVRLTFQGIPLRISCLKRRAPSPTQAGSMANFQVLPFLRSVQFFRQAVLTGLPRLG